MVETTGYLAEVAEAELDFLLEVLLSDTDEEDVSSLQSAPNFSLKYLAGR